MVNVTVTGQDRIGAQLKSVSDAILKASAKSLGRDLALMDTDAKQSISGGSRSGKTYKRGNITHVASAASELPKTDRGELVAGFLFAVKRRFNGVSGNLVNKSRHAAALEFKPAAKGGRPFMRPLFKKWFPKIKTNLVTVIKAELKRIR